MCNDVTAAVHAYKVNLFARECGVLCQPRLTTDNRTLTETEVAGSMGVSVSVRADVM